MSSRTATLHIPTGSVWGLQMIVRVHRLFTPFILHHPSLGTPFSLGGNRATVHPISLSPSSSKLPLHTCCSSPPKQSRVTQEKPSAIRGLSHCPRDSVGQAIPPLQVTGHPRRAHLLAGLAGVTGCVSSKRPCEG